MMHRMLRAVLVGLLSVSALACKSGGDSPKSQPGVAAGKVVEVTGTVTVRHDDVARPLAAGETVEGEDVVETGADGNVVIELSHNLARWELAANKKMKVRESLAWSQPKKEGSAAAVEQTAAAAGRHAERSAAETSVSGTADKGAPPAETARAAEAAPAPTAAPAPEPTAAAQSPRAESPPPPPPAPERRRAAESAEAPAKLKKSASPFGDDKTFDEPSGGGGSVTTRGGKIATAAAKPVVDTKALQACLTKDAQHVTVTIKIAADGKATAVVGAKAEIPEEVTKCIVTAVGKMKFAAAAASVTLDVRK